MSVWVRMDGKLLRVDEPVRPGGPWKITPEGGEAVEIAADVATISPGTLSILSTGRSVTAIADEAAGEASVLLNGVRYMYAMEDPRSLASRRAAGGGADGPKQIISPMPGRVVRILVSPGDSVTAKQGVLVVEAMKMQNELKSPKDGVVQAILAEAGDTVAAGQPLATIA